MAVTATIDKAKNELVLRIPMNKKPEPSSSGKSLVVASTHGNQTTDLKIDGKLLVVGCNAYIKN